MIRSQLPIVCAVLCVLSGTVFAEDGVSGGKIMFGQVAALSGPAQDSGQGMRQSILAAFEETNRRGGVAGRGSSWIRSTTAMSRKRPSAPPTVGTPTSKAGQPIATAAKVTFIGPFTGAEFLRNPYNRYVVNVRASYFQETEAWIEHLTRDLGVSRIAILYQDDPFGLAGWRPEHRSINRSTGCAGSWRFRPTPTCLPDC